MRVYIAGSSQETARAMALADRLERAGHIITSTWWTDIAAVGEANPRAASAEQRRNWAGGCLCQVGSSDAVVFLVPVSPAVTRGGWAEIGYALRDGLLVACVGDTKQSVFCALGTELERDEDVLAWLGYP